MSRQILLGTTNPSKVKRFEWLLNGYDVSFLTLYDIGVYDVPEESGATPEENAAIKARFYSQYCPDVICNDSGLYFDSLPLDDARQPGLHIRTPQGVHLDDSDMITYYSALVQSLGGEVLAYYIDGMAVACRGEVFAFCDDIEVCRRGAFRMVSQPHPKRHKGWPLDSLSQNIATGKYFVEETAASKGTEDNIIYGEYMHTLRAFLARSLGLEQE